MNISKDKRMAGLAMSVTLVAANSLGISHAIEQQDNGIINEIESRAQQINDRASIAIYKVTTDSLNVRKGPGTSYTAIGTIKKGDKIEVQSISNGWAKITYNGGTAYASASYLEKTSDTVLNKSLGEITESTYIRSSKSWSSTKLLLLKKGDKVDVIEKGADWTKVSKDNKTGYVANDYIKTSASTNQNTGSSNTSQGTNATTENQGVITESTYIRSSKSWSSTKLLLVKKGDSVKVIEKGADWTKVSKDNKTGYVANDYIKTSASTNQNTGSSNTSQGTNATTENQGVITESTYIRSSKSWSSTKLLLVKKGDSVKVIEKGADWTKVSKDNKTGYVANDYIDVKEDVKEETTTKYKVTTDGLNVRKGPATSYSVLGSVNKGDIIEVYSIANGWAKISYKGGVAYCSANYVEKHKESSSQEAENKYKVTTNNLNVRKGPSTSYKIVGSIHEGDVIEVESISNGWAKFKFNGEDAYCSADYLEKYNADSNSNATVGKKTIFIDAGHGGTDPGAIGTTYGYKEKDGTLDVTSRVVSKLKSKGHNVKTSRDTDIYVTLANRTAGAKNAKADLFVSMHFNSATSSSAEGIETLYKPDSRNSDVAADKVQKELIRATGLRNRGLKTRTDLYVLNNTGTIPAILVEGGFLSNSSEENKIKNADFREKLANAIVSGIEAYFKVTK